MTTKKLLASLIWGLSIILCLFLLLANTLSWTPLWSLMDLFTQDSVLNIYLLYGIVVIASLVLFIFQARKKQMVHSVPIALNLVTITLLATVPFRDIGLKNDIEQNYQQRREVVRLVESGELQADGRGRVALPFRYRYLSKDGGEIYVIAENGAKQILFYTYRGILDNFSGLVYSSTDTAPKNGAFGADIKHSERLRSNWYWLESR